jgi:serine/threonine protein kinase/WD40 repeat protein
MTTTHPSDRELHSFLLGRLTDPDHSQVESHLAECSECGDRALAAPADDTLTELLAAARTRFDSQRASAPTPTLDGSATPPAFAPTLAWSSSTGSDSDTIPAALATHPKYRVLRRLGTGGMGTVWLAEHLVMNRPVAVKVIRPDLLARPGATGRFLREVRAAAKLHHSNIVTAFDAEPAGDSCLLVMEYVPGQTLGERLEAGPLPVAEACRAVRDAARGLAHAHAAGLVHRDVKPHNLIRAGDGTTKVLDFGLAGVGAGETVAPASDGLTGAGMVVGTPDYIAPEQIADPHAADARADIYGLGYTLYHLLAGRPPLPDGSVALKLAAQRTHKPSPIPDLPPGLAEILAKMMAKDPEDRYQTADELLAALAPFCEGPVSRDARAERARRPYRWLAIAAGVLLLMTAGLVFKIQRDNQVITVETNDPDIEVVMKRKGEVLRVIDKRTGQEWEIDTAKNEIAQADSPGGLTVKLPDTEPFVLRRSGKDVFTVTRLRKAGPAPVVAKIGELRRFEAHTEGVLSVAFSPDERHAYSCAEDGFVRSWDLATGAELWAYDAKIAPPEWKLLRDIAISPDGTRALVAAYDFSVRVLNTATAKEVSRFTRHRAWVHSVSISADGRRALSSSHNWQQDKPDQDSSVRMWEVATGKELQVFKTVRPLRAVFVPGDRFVLSVDGDGQVRVWDIATAEEVRRFDVQTNGVFSVAVSPDGARALTASWDKTVRLWDVSTGKELRTFKGHTDKVVSVAFTADARRALSASEDGTVRLWDVDTGKELHCCVGHSDRVYSAAITRDGRYALSGSKDRTVRYWGLPAATPAAGLPDQADIERRIDPAKGDGRNLPFALLEQNKVAVLRFGKWRLVFEGVACDSGGKVLFGVGSFFLPETGGRGNFVDPGLRPPAPMLGQQWNGQTNEIILKNYRFEMEAKGARLVFPDKTYEATDQVQTIVIARDGTTRAEPAAKK